MLVDLLLGVTLFVCEVCIREVCDDSILFSAVDVGAHSGVVDNLQDVLYELFLLHCLLVVDCLLIVDVVDCPNDVDANLDCIFLLEVHVDKVSTGCSGVDVVIDLL